MKIEGRFLPKATAFVVMTGIEGFEGSFRHLVTAEHVVAKALNANQPLWVRYNLKSGGTAEHEIPNRAWKFHPDNAQSATDVAACIWNQKHEDEDVLGFPVTGPRALVATNEVMADLGIGLGDETFAVGLFRNHFGQQRNVPVARFGNLSAIGDEPVHTNYCGATQAYLIEARSIGGLSGSPVFVNFQRTRFSDSRRSEDDPSGYALLLGLVHGHFDVQNTTEDMAMDDEAGSRGINAGIGVVIPVEKIIETLNQPYFSERQQRVLDSLSAVPPEQSQAND